MIRKAALEILRVEAGGDSETGVEEVVEAPGHFIAVGGVFLNAEAGELVGVVAEALGGEEELVEAGAAAVAGVEREGGAEEAEAIAEVDVAAVFAAVTIDGGEAVAGFQGLADVIRPDVFATGRADGVRRGGDGLLGEEDEEEGRHRRKLGEELEPWMREWQRVQFW